MSQTLTNNSRPYVYNPSLRSAMSTDHNYAAIAYTLFVFFITTLLIGLGIRLALALLVVGGHFSVGLTVFTDPFVMPFTRIFHDAHGMVQPATGLAFSAYYLVYWLIALISKLLHRTHPYSAVNS